MGCLTGVVGLFVATLFVLDLGMRGVIGVETAALLLMAFTAVAALGFRRLVRTVILIGSLFLFLRTYGAEDSAAALASLLALGIAVFGVYVMLGGLQRGRT